MALALTSVDWDTQRRRAFLLGGSGVGNGGLGGGGGKCGKRAQRRNECQGQMA